ncbi:MAG: hypothetical protein JWL77_3653 [Chthonomonadaceae bacterium]|nr:hypothetical protein [Chthonomonadaceae bacterium]
MSDRIDHLPPFYPEDFDRMLRERDASRGHLTRRFFLALPLAASLSAQSTLSAKQSQPFLSLRHAWCPYALPAETTLQEIESVAQRGFDAVGVSFVGPYNGGHIDFTTLDAAVALVAKYGARTVLHLAPRFSEGDRMGDTLHDGTFLPHVWNRSPNYSVVDIFDPRQQALFFDYLSRVAQRYGGDKRIAGFALGWGYMGETGFFFGDFLSDFTKIGATCAGYSEHALRAFNRRRAAQKRPPIATLPLPSPTHQSADYIAFQQFRAGWVRDTFQRGMVAAVKAHTRTPVGIFGYIAANPNNYARCWQSTPNADFYRSAASASSFDITHTLLDSGVGWEDAELHDGKWDFTSACMRRDEARQIARGAAFHAMHIRVYKTDLQWEPEIYDKICAFLKTQTLSQQIRHEPPTVALYQPTWGTAALPAQSAQQPFLPNRAHAAHITKMIGLVESFGLPYRLITEADLLTPSRLRPYQHLILPLWDVLDRILTPDAYHRLTADKRVLRIPLADNPLPRTTLRTLLHNAGISPRLDFDADTVLAGRTSNLLYNWTNAPRTVRIQEKPEPLTLAAHEYQLI